MKKFLVVLSVIPVLLFSGGCMMMGGMHSGMNMDHSNDMEHESAKTKFQDISAELKMTLDYSKDNGLYSFNTRLYGVSSNKLFSGYNAQMDIYMLHGEKDTENSIYEHAVAKAITGTINSDSSYTFKHALTMTGAHILIVTVKDIPGYKNSDEYRFYFELQDGAHNHETKNEPGGSGYWLMGGAMAVFMAVMMIVR